MSNLLKDVSGGEWCSSIVVASTGERSHHVMLAAQPSPDEISIIGCAYGNTPEEALANAKLMAAAKDMAEALIRSNKSLRAWHEKYGEFQPQWLPPANDAALLEDMDAALKKAGAA